MRRTVRLDHTFAPGRPAAREETTILTLCVAHRGGSLLAPENTLAAFEAGIAAGADWVECDVHMARDGSLVVIHDADLRRTTDRAGQVGRLTLDEIRLANAAAKFPDRRFDPQRVPTLEEVLAALPERVGVQVEIKVPEGGPYPGIERRVCNCLRQGGMVARSAVISFDPRTLSRVREAAPEVPAGFLVSERRLPVGDGAPVDRIAATARAGGAAFAGLELKLVSPDLVAGLRNAGLGVAVWTVNDAPDMRACRDLGVDAVASDRPDLLRKVLDGRD